MSYILDALKKNQIEETQTGVSLQPPRRGVPTWLAAGLVMVILINLGLVAWIYFSGTEDEQQVATGPTNETLQPIPATETPAPAETATNPTPAAATATEPQTAAQRVPADSAPAPSAARPTPAPETREQQPAPAAAPPIALRDLPASERILYDGFSYSTHIYTDDPSLCAIVVNGQRLTAGDSFQGLKVIAITEVGVVFEENRRGQRRQIEVSVLEQWDSE